MASVNKDREFDIVLYGASGFTGKYVLEEFHKSEYAKKYKFAVAGRNESKLKKSLADVGALIETDLTNVPIIIADTGNETQLQEMAKRAKVVINGVGPFRLYGEPVVKACVDNGTHHVDISGEPAWLEKMQLLYNDKAKETGACIVQACGWDSIPVDLGVHFAKQNFDGTLGYIETFVHLKTPRGYSANAGTFQTMLLALTGRDNLGETRRKLMPEKLNKYKAPKHPLVWYNNELSSYILPFPGSDKSVAFRSQYHKAIVDKEVPVSVETYLIQKSWIQSWITVLYFIVMAVVCRIPPLLRFCQAHPDLMSVGFFSVDGPKRKFVKNASFTTHIKGHGWKGAKEPKLDVEPTDTVTVRVDGPDAGYEATAGFVLSSAITVLENEIPKSGGVFTTAVAFGNSQIFDRLRKFNITFMRVGEQPRATEDKKVS